MTNPANNVSARLAQQLHKVMRPPFVRMLRFPDGPSFTPDVASAALSVGLLESTTHADVSGTAVTQPLTEITIERTGCTDPCPAYRAILTKDGTALYQGNDESALPGTWKGEIAKEDFDALSSLVQHLHYASLQDQYGGPGLHFGPVITSVVNADSRKTVVNYGFYRPSGPLALQWIEAAIDVIIQHRVENWAKLSEERYATIRSR